MGIAPIRMGVAVAVAVAALALFKSDNTKCGVFLFFLADER